MKKVFISGGITGVTNWQDRFTAAEGKILKLFDEEDVVVYNPLRFPKPDFDPNDKQDEWRAYMRVTITNLMQCNTIYMLKGWEKSRGSFDEFYMAKELGMDIYYEE